MTARSELLEALNAKIEAIEADGGLSAPTPEADTVEVEAQSKAAEAVSDESEAAYQKLLALIAIREHSTKTIAKRLSRVPFDEQAIATAVDRATRLGLIDDRRYSDMLIRQRLAAGKGLAPTFREIEALGIDPLTLDAYEEYAAGGDDAERERARALLDRHPTHAKNLRDGAFRKLVTQGFPTGIAMEVARTWAAEREERL